MRNLVLTRWPVLLATLAFILVQLPFVFHDYSFGFDEGVYWQSLRLVSQGFAPYKEIYLSQPPVFAAFLKLISTAVGDELWLIRLAFTLVSALFIPMMAVIVDRLGLSHWTNWTAWLAATHTPFFQLSHQITGGAPALAIGAIALAAALQPNILGAALAGFFAAAAVGTKMSMISLIPIALLAVAYPANRAARITTFALSLVLTFLLIAQMDDWWTFGLKQTQGGALTAPAMSDAKTFGSLSLMNRIAFFFWPSMDGEWPNPLAYWFFCLSCLVLVFRGAYRWALGLSFIFLLAALPLAMHKTVFPQHFAILFPIVILATVKIFDEIRSWRAWAAAGWLGISILVSAVSYTESFLGLSTATFRRSEEHDVSAFLRQHILADRWVVGDAHFAVANAGLTSPPFFADLSRVRLNSGGIHCDDLTQVAHDAKVQALVIGKRLQSLSCGTKSLSEKVKGLDPRWRHQVIGKTEILWREP